MPSAEWARDAAALWDIAVPSVPHRLPGLAMAGFRTRAGAEVDLQIVPYPAVTLAVDLGDDGLLVDEANGGRLRGSAAYGLAPKGLRARGRDLECLQVRLSPVLAHAVLGAGADLGEAAVALDDLWGAEAERLRDRLRAAPTWAARFALAEEALARRLDERRAADPEVAYAWDAMVGRRGQLRVDDVAAETGWSRKRLWARFRAQVGLTPKRAARLVRFDHAAHRLAAGHPAATVAAEAGYADQSHLHRDAVAFTGLPPTAVGVAPWLAVDDIAWAAPGR